MSHELWEQGYYNYYFPYNFNGDDCIADAEFGIEDELISVVLHEKDEYGHLADMIVEILPKDLDKQFINKITNQWKKTREVM